MEFVAAREIPPVVYVPITEVDHEGRARIQMRRLKNGQLAVAAFSALDRLQSSMGRAQKWMLVHVSDLQSQAAGQNISRVLVDPDFREDHVWDGRS